MRLWPSRRRLIVETIGSRHGMTYFADRDEWRLSPEALRQVMEQAFAEGRLSGLMEEDLPLLSQTAES